MNTVKKDLLAKDLLRLAKRRKTVQRGNITAGNNLIRKGPLTIKLADTWGFCYGVLYAIEEVGRVLAENPDKTIWVLGDLIHNPHVNQELQRLGAKFIGLDEISIIGEDDIIVIPAFGTKKNILKELNSRNLQIINTTCPEVQTVEEKVQEFNGADYTAIIHGKFEHQESIATSSYAHKYLIVRNEEESRYVCDYILNGGDREEFLNKFRNSCSPDFDPDKDLIQIGMANQTTMLMNESLKIFEIFRETIHKRDGGEKNFKSIRTICSATQDRQDAVKNLIQKNGFDFFIVVGGHNSSNTQNLARSVHENSHIPVYHIENPDSFNENKITYLPPGEKKQLTKKNWLPDGQITVGITAGASTPHSQLERVIQKLLSFF
ncbi:MAG: 4-hydroxy-3-methylbut-2-enyl diphosphate reductase [bacterium]